jgi:hypothetical protein
LASATTKYYYDDASKTCLPKKIDCNGPRGGQEVNLHPTQIACVNACSVPAAADDVVVSKPRPYQKPVPGVVNCVNTYWATTLKGCVKKGTLLQHADPVDTKWYYDPASKTCKSKSIDCNGPGGGPEDNLHPTKAACESACGSSPPSPSGPSAPTPLAA